MAREGKPLQRNGTGRPMGICVQCYEKLFTDGPTYAAEHARQDPLIYKRLTQIQRAAREGLRRLKTT